MEFKEAVGTRRSIRMWLPYRPVEPEKIEAILEAIYTAPRVLEADFLRVVVMHRDDISHEDLEAMKTPTTMGQIDLCPIYMFMYSDLAALERATDGKNLEQMIDIGALNRSHGWTRDFIQSTIIPDIYRRVLDDENRIAQQFRTEDGTREGPSTSRELMVLGRIQLGIAQAYALLAAVDQGLGVQLTNLTDAVPRRLMGIPDSWFGDNPMFVGYCAEDREAGGQRPREPLEEDYFEGHYGVPFRRDAGVVEQLEEADMIQQAAPLPWRRDELRRLARMFGLPE